MKKLNSVVAFVVLLLPATAVRADSGLEEYFYSSGKIRVVIAVAAVVLAGLIGYLVMLDRKVKKLEEKSGK